MWCRQPRSRLATVQHQLCRTVTAALAVIAEVEKAARTCACHGSVTLAALAAICGYRCTLRSAGVPVAAFGVGSLITDFGNQSFEHLHIFFVQQ